MMNKKYYSTKQESLIANELGWECVVASGSRPGFLGDVYSDNWLGECKTHVNPGNKITFVFDVWNKIQDESASRFKYPVLFVDDGSQDIDKTWCMFNTIPVVESSLCVKYPYKYSKNVSFNSEDLSIHMKLIRPSSECLVYYVTNFHGKDVFIANLETFEQLFRLGR